MNTDHEYHDELTAYLAMQEHPRPHPNKCYMGYIKHNAAPAVESKDDGLDAFGELPLDASWPWPLLGAVGIALSSLCAGYLLWQLFHVLREMFA